MFTRGGRLAYGANRLHLNNFRFRYTHDPSFDTTDHDTPPLKLKLVVPPNTEPEIFTVDDAATLHDFVESFNGYLCTLGANDTIQIVSPTKYKSLVATEVYEVCSPFFNVVRKERQPSRIGDRPFEENARRVMIKYLSTAEKAPRTR